MTVQNDIHRPHVLPLQIEAGKSKDSSRLPHHGFPLVLVQGCGRKFFSCSGNGNGRSWNNRGSNGNYWSSTWNSARNARNLNFNSGGVNPQDNNNRYNGFAVRPVQHTILTFILSLSYHSSMTLTRQQLLLDLYQAFYSAQRHKSKRSYVRKWQRNLKQNMESLCDDLYYRRYKPLPSKCFIVEYPKKREIFAAVFRDRIVHHLYFNYTHELYERTFIADSYSCIKGRGTLYGIRRIADMCRKESQNWQRRCYAFHLDIRGYFMHINRKRLLEITTELLRNMASHHLSETDRRTWGDVLDMNFLTWLTGVIILLDPKENCIIVGNPSAWDDLDPSKSLLHLPPGIGLPIGNLTSQLFSNVYLNTFDQYMKRVMKCKRYGRYVDDAIVVSTNKQWLILLIPAVRQFLQERLCLELHQGKLELSEVHRGVEFLGAYIKPYRIYVARHAVKRMQKKIAEFDYTKPWVVVRSVNSYLGIFSHTATYNLRSQLLMNERIMRIGRFDELRRKLRDRKITNKHLKTKQL